MKTMGLSDLCLVNPRDFPADDAEKMAAGATDVLANATVSKSLSGAIADCALKAIDQEVVFGVRPENVRCVDENDPSALATPIDIDVQTAIERQGAELFGRVTLGELTADDISTIEAGQAPGARFRGQYRVEKDFGKFDFDKCKPGVPVRHQDMPSGVRDVLGLHDPVPAPF